MSDPNDRPVLAVVLRSALVLTALSLFVYIPYRYVARPPELGGLFGTGYALLFPLSGVLAAAALAAAWRPGVLEALERGPGAGRDGSHVLLRGGLGAYGVTWMAMGLMCLPSLTALAAVSPVEGLFSGVHMTAQHVFLGAAAVGAAASPATALSLLTGQAAAGEQRAEARSVGEPA